MSGENPKVVKQTPEQEPKPKFDDLLKEISPSVEPIKKEPTEENVLNKPVEPKSEAVQVQTNSEPIEKAESVVTEKPVVAEPIALKVEKPEEPLETKPVEVAETKPTSEPIKKEEPVIEKPTLEEKPKMDVQPKENISDLDKDKNERFMKDFETVQKAEKDDDLNMAGVEEILSRR